MSNLVGFQRTIGRLGTAPCGHQGEAIIGQFYRCLTGCDDVHPVQPVARTGLPGHVGCKCMSCILIQEATELVVGTMTSRVFTRYAKVPWDGTPQTWRIPAHSTTITCINHLRFYNRHDLPVWEAGFIGVFIGQNMVGATRNGDHPAFKLGLEFRQNPDNPSNDTIIISHIGCP